MQFCDFNILNRHRGKLFLRTFGKLGHTLKKFRTFAKKTLCFQTVSFENMQEQGIEKSNLFVIGN